MEKRKYRTDVTETVCFRVSAQEKYRLSLIAKREGLSPTELIRRCLKEIIEA
jgi:hypothetical protein